MGSLWFNSLLQPCEKIVILILGIFVQCPSNWASLPIREKFEAIQELKRQSWKHGVDGAYYIRECFWFIDDGVLKEVSSTCIYYYYYVL